ncbi:MAG TPA: hypothetical protein VMV07_10050 [Streptosporangiaceae bacterium]|nr:hypothetical protein [Streptosporangiaceae bacterium]
MKISVDAAMRARDVSRGPDGDAEPAGPQEPGPQQADPQQANPRKASPQQADAGPAERATPSAHHQHRKRSRRRGR